MRTKGETKGKRVNMTEFCQILDITRKTARDWIDKGMPIVQKADRKRKLDYLIDTLAAIEWRYQPGVTNANNDLSATELKRRILALQYESEEIDLIKKRDELVYIDDVHTFIRDQYTRIRQALRQVPARVAPLLIHEKEEFKIKEIVLGDIDNTLLALSQPQIKDSHVVMEMDGVEDNQEE